MKLITLFGILLILSWDVRCENDTFVATDEWQEIQPGQQIPPGLHVRIDMSTGRKEAKILEESRDTDEAAKAGESSAESPTQAISVATNDDEIVKRALETDFKEDEIRSQYKSYKELKKSYEEMKPQFTTDRNVIADLIEQYTQFQKSPEDLVKKTTSILEDLVTLVDEIDNAQWFVDAGGLDTILHPIVVNETNVNLRVHAMRVLGALTQNNPKTQEEAFKRNFGSHLAQILISSTHTEELSAALYAFGSLVRHFPYAQHRMFSTSGIQALTAVLSKECELRLKAKAATLIHDLIADRLAAMEQTTFTTGPERNDRSLYATLDYRRLLLANSYCETMDSLIGLSLYEFLEQPDTAEYFLEALASTADYCLPLWSQSPQMRHTLLTCGNRYKRSDDPYRQEVAVLVQKVVLQLYPDSETRDEL